MSDMKYDAITAAGIEVQRRSEAGSALMGLKLFPQLYMSRDLLKSAAHECIARHAALWKTSIAKMCFTEEM
eukprot:206172-Pleurochrysis_carterae.AAC.1